MAKLEYPIYVTAVSEVGNLACIWGQVDFDTYAIVEELLTNVEQTGSPKSVELGDIVIAKYEEDQSYYRAQVRSIDKASQKCKVFFMDFGNEETVSMKDFVKGSPQCYDAPPLATKYILADLQAKDSKRMSSEEIQVIQDSLMNSEANIRILHEGSVGVPPTIRVFTDSNTSIAAELVAKGAGISYMNSHLNFPAIKRLRIPTNRRSHVYVSYSESAVKFWLQLVSEEEVLQDHDARLQEDAPRLVPIPAYEILCGKVCVAKYEGEIYYRGVISAVHYEQQTATVTFIDYGNSSDVAFCDVLSLPAASCSLPAQAIECSLSGSSVNTAKFDVLIESETVFAEVISVLQSGLHIVNLYNEDQPAHRSAARINQVDRNAVSPPTATVFTSYSPMQFNLASFIDVCISHVEEQGLFYCQLLDRATSLDDLMCRTQKAQLVPMKGAIKDGTCCLAISSSDKVIYRAQIMSGTVAGPQVRFVDFGIVETVPASNLFQLPVDLAQTPMHAVCCSLSESDSLTHNQLLRLLNQYNSKKPCVAKVVLRTTKAYEVDLFDTSKSDQPLVSLLSNEDSVSNTPASSKHVQLQKARINKGTAFNVIGSVVLSPAVFYAQFADFQVEELESLGSSMLEYYSNNAAPYCGDIGKGDVCVCEFSEDRAFYRARVLDRRGDVALVTFVDYGNKEKKNVSELRALMPQFSAMPVAGALFDIGDGGYQVTDVAVLEELLLEKEFTVVCDEQKGDVYMTRFPRVEANSSILERVRPVAQKSVSHSQTTMIANPRQPSPAVRSSGPRTTLDCPIMSEGHSEEVQATFVTDPGNFIIQPTNCKEQLDALMDAIDAHCSKPNYNQQFPCSMGSPVLAKYSEDGGWYRATVTGVMRSSGKYEVHFVDYGNKDVVGGDELREMLPEHMELPAQAYQCCLNGIDQSSSSNPWQQGQIDQFCSAIMDCNLSMKFIHKRSSDDSYLVEAFRDGISVNKSFLQACGRLSRKYQENNPPNKQVNGNDAQNNWSGGWKQPNAAPTQQHIVTKVLNPKPIELEKYTEFIVPFGISPSKFWCQLAASGQQLEEMQTAVSNDYSGSTDVLANPIPGQFCCALYAEDETWYRAQIKELKGNVASVYFVDYGNVEDVPLSELRELKDKYYLLPMQAVQCELFGVESAGPGPAWKKEACDAFLDLAMKESVVACPTHKNSDGTFVVELVDKDSSQPIHEQLIKLKLAKSSIPDEMEDPKSRRLSGASTSSRTSTSSRSSVTSETSKIKPILLKNSESVEVYVVHIDSLSSIYCQLTSESVRLQEVMDNIAKDYGSLSPSELLLKAALPGSVCCAKYSIDEGWYRGEILEVASDKCKVRFVDYGDVEWVESSNVKQLTRPYISLPMQAIQVSLSDVVVIPAKEAAARDQLEQMAEDQCMQLTIQSRSRDGVHAGTLSLNGASLGQKLVEGNLAQSSKQSSALVSPPKLTAYPILQLELGQKFAVMISWVVSPTEFYCQAYDNEGALVELAEKLKDTYESLRLNELAMSNPQIGDSCVAYYADDGNWYRGKILKMRGHEAMVKYIDYGNREKVPLSKIKKAREDYLAIPMQAVQCSLKGAQMVNNQWPDAVVSLFGTLTSGSVVMQPLSLEDDRYIVELNNKEHTSIASHVKDLLEGKQAPRNTSQDYGARQQPQGGRSGSSWGEEKAKPSWGGGNESKPSFGSEKPAAKPSWGEDRASSSKPSWGQDKPARGGQSWGDNKPARGVSKPSFGGEKPSWGDKKPTSSVNSQSKPSWGAQKSGGGGAGDAWDSDPVPPPMSKPPQADTPLQYPKATITNSVAEGYIASVTTPQQFYVQLTNTEDELATFATKVLNEYNGLSTGDRKISNLKLKQPCCALFADDEAWYRAEVTSIQNNQATVLFVDYGNSTTSNISGIRALTKDLAAVPLYALECKLKGVSRYTDEDIQKINELAAEKSFKVHFHTKTAPFEVSVFDEETDLLDLIPSGRTQTEASCYESLVKPQDGVAYVSHIVSPSEFYLQFASQEDKLESLTEELQSNAPSASNLSNPSVGSPCAAVFSEDMAWYRAQIISISGSKATVKFIDHGNEEELDVSGLKEVPSLSPPIAIHCYIGSKQASWTEADVEKFSELVLEKALQVSLSGAEQPYCAVLADTDAGIVINDQFKPKVQDSVVAQTPQTTSAPTQEVYNYPDYDTSTLSGRLKVFVSHIDSPSSLYIQLVKMETDLNVILDDLDEKFSNASPEDCLRTPQVGIACCAKYSDDGVWYRAQVLSVSDEQTKVQFIDYGNCDTPSADSIYPLKPDCPPMAVHCSLSGIQEPEGGWTDEMIDKFHDLTSDKMLTVDVRKLGQTCQIDLFEQEQNIGDILRELYPQLQSTESSPGPDESTEPSPGPDAEPQSTKEGITACPVPAQLSVVYVSHVTSPSLFYLQQAGVEDELAAIGEKIGAIADDAAFKLNAVEAQQICCAQSAADNEWYRGLVTTFDASTDHANVFYLDYGNSEDLPVANLRNISPELKSQHKLALECQLDGLQGIEWSETDSNSLLEETQDVELTVEFVTSSTEPHAIVLKKDGESIAEKLFRSRLKTDVISLKETAANVEVPEDVVTEEEAEDTAEEDKSTDKEAESDIGEIVVAKIEQALESTSEVTNQKEESEGAKSDNIVPAAADFSEGVAPSPELPKPMDMACLPAPYTLPEGEKVEVCVSWPETPSKFYIQLTSKDEDLKNLEDELHSYYSELETGGDLLSPFEPCTLCAAKYDDGDEEKWYRGQIASVHDDDTACVFFIDWGNRETLPRSSLRCLDDSFLSLPAHTLPCCLSNVQPITDDWSEEAVACFLEKVQSSDKFLCKGVQMVGKVHEVELLDMGVSLADYLKKQGHAIDIVDTESDQEAEEYITQIPPAVAITHKKVEVCITYIENPHNFWIQLKPNVVVSDLADSMLDFYTGKEAQPVSEIAIGKYYAIQSEDSCDRAKVEAKLEEDKLTIVFVDYGYSDEIESTQVFPLSRQFDAPVQCYPCRLVDVEPMGDETEWSYQATDVMNELTEDKVLLMEIIKAEDTEGEKKYSVRLLDMGIPLSRMLVDAGMAKLQEEVVTDEFEDSVEESATEDQSRSVAVSEFIEELITKAKDIAIQKVVEGFESKSAEELMSASQEIDGSKTLIEVAYLHGDTPENFYVQLRGDGAQNFDQLEIDLEEYFKEAISQADMEKVQSLNTSDTVLVKENDKCYRGSVINVVEEIEVSLVDYGKKTTVLMKDVIPLDESQQERWFSIPSQAMQCKLEGVENPQWSAEALEYFEGLLDASRSELASSTITLRIVSEDDHDVCSVYLYAGTTERDTTVNMRLVQEGHATVIPGCQLDIDLDLETENISDLESSFLEESMQRSNSLGSLDQQVDEQSPDSSLCEIPEMTATAGEELQMKVTAILDPDNITLVDMAHADRMVLLREDMQAHYTDIGPPSLESLVFACGEPCAVQSEDGVWCRCEVTAVQEDKLTVLMVDTCKQMMVHREEARKMEARFCVQPAQAIQASLDVGQETMWPQGIGARMLTACGDDLVTVSVISLDEEDGRPIVAIKTRDNVDLSTLCKEAAEEEEREIVQAEQEEQQIEYGSTIESRQVECGDKLKVELAAVESPVRFWCQLKPEEAKALAEQIHDFYESSAETSHCPEEELCEGSACAAVYAGGDIACWHRAVVRSVYDGVYTVQFVDRGGQVQTTPAADVRKLPERFSRCTGYAVMCGLPGIEPPTAEQEEWSEVAVEHMETFCSTSLDLQVLELPESDDAPILVDLRSGDTAIRQSLIDLNLAKQKSCRVTELHAVQSSVDATGDHKHDDEEFDTPEQNIDTCKPNKGSEEDVDQYEECKDSSVDSEGTDNGEESKESGNKVEESVTRSGEELVTQEDVEDLVSNDDSKEEIERDLEGQKEQDIVDLNENKLKEDDDDEQFEDVESPEEVEASEEDKVGVDASLVELPESDEDEAEEPLEESKEEDFYDVSDEFGEERDESKWEEVSKTEEEDNGKEEGVDKEEVSRKEDGSEEIPGEVKMREDDSKGEDEVIDLTADTDSDASPKIVTIQDDTRDDEFDDSDATVTFDITCDELLAVSRGDGNDEVVMVTAVAASGVNESEYLTVDDVVEVISSPELVQEENKDFDDDVNKENVSPGAEVIKEVMEDELRSPELARKDHEEDVGELVCSPRAAQEVEAEKSQEVIEEDEENVGDVVFSPEAMQEEEEEQTMQEVIINSPEVTRKEEDKALKEEIVDSPVGPNVEEQQELVCSPEAPHETAKEELNIESKVCVDDDEKTKDEI